MRTFLLSTALSLSVFTCTNTVDAEKEKKPIEIDSVSMAERGKYLVTITGCNDCHTPKKMGPRGPELITEQLLSGYQSSNPVSDFDVSRAKKGMAQMSEDMTAAAGPWGISFAANLTPHETGIGNWTYENFKKHLLRENTKEWKTAECCFHQCRGSTMPK